MYVCSKVWSKCVSWETNERSLTKKCFIHTYVYIIITSTSKEECSIRPSLTETVHMQ